MNRNWPKFAVLALIASALTAYFLLDLGSHLNLENLKARRGELLASVDQRPAEVGAIFFLIYVAVAALSLPGAAILTIAAGAIFGLWTGVLIVSFASAVGASLAFLSSRYLLRDWVTARFAKRIEAIDRGIREDGAIYLLSLRLIPAFPFFLINLAMGLTNMRLATFYLVSQIGMLPGTLLFVNAGVQLSEIQHAGEVLSPALLGSLALLGLFPLFAKLLIGWWKRRRVYRGFRKPGRYDRNLVVIGGGAGGLVTAYIAATVRAKVTLIEAAKMGGDCLNTGCVPSKALIRTARLAQEMRNASRFGLVSIEPRLEFPAVMARVNAIIRQIEPADSAERYKGLGVDVRQGHARLIDPWTVEIDGGERITTRSIVIAAGAEPRVPDLPGLREAGYLTSETMWDALSARATLPARVAILGGGPIGTEMAQAFARLGSKVTQIERTERILPGEDAEVSAFIAAKLRDEGVEIRTGHEAVRCEGKVLVARCGDTELRIPFDEIIVALGRKARVTGYGLEELGVATAGTVTVNGRLETNFPNIFAVGDVAGPYQFTHFAAHQAWYAAVNALFGTWRKFRADYSLIPWVTYTEPEAAHVGLTEAEAQERGVAYEIVRFDLDHLDRAVTESANEGFVKLLVRPGTDHILGVTIVAANGGEMLAEYVLAMKHNIGLNKILGTVHAYPTMSEANKYAAGEWKKAHKPDRLLALVERYHRWRRR
jgi:pyruvate/2-oxoglutarate dehydrogenase complex dihydrolipoamide dehydrogenase (E3) component/uncharacterized membrane protein YdjX (TVP38/TMEM64 family)